MFKLLERYILKKHIKAFLFFVFAFVLIICVIDFTEKNDDFMHHELSYWVVFRDYYFRLIPYLANFLSPIMIFLSTIFVTSKLASHTELIAIMSSGVSFGRIVWIYIKGSIFIAIVTFFMIGWLIPNSNKVRVDFEREYLKNAYQYEKLHTHVKVSDDTYVYIKSYMNERNYGTDFSIERFEGKELVYKLQSARVKWDTLIQKWHVDRYTLRTYKDGVENLSYGTDLDTSINLFPKDFQSSFKKQEALTIPELKAFIAEQKKRGFQNIKLYEIEYYERFTYPFAIIILTVLGVIVSARKSRNGIASQIMLGLVLALTFVMFIMVGRNFAQDGTLHPLITAVTPDVLFAFIAFVLYKKLPQ